MLKIEMKKLKVTNLLITILVIPLLANIFGLINFMGNRELLTNSWKSLWTQVSLFYFMFFLTPLIAIIVSTLWSVEHKAGLKLIRICPIKNIKFIISKAFISFILIAIAQFYFLFLFIIFGKFICGFKEINLNLYIYYIILYPNNYNNVLCKYKNKIPRYKCTYICHNFDCRICNACSKYFPFTSKYFCPKQSRY